MERMVNTRDPARSVFRLSWDSDARWLRQYAAQVLGDDGDGLVCFRVSAGHALFVCLLLEKVILAVVAARRCRWYVARACCAGAASWRVRQRARLPRTSRLPSWRQLRPGCAPRLQTALAGVGNLTRRGRASDALPYRAAVAERLGLVEVPVGQEERPVITMLDKDVSAHGACTAGAEEAGFVQPPHKHVSAAAALPCMGRAHALHGQPYACFCSADLHWRGKGETSSLWPAAGPAHH